MKPQDLLANYMSDDPMEQPVESIAEPVPKTIVPNKQPRILNLPYRIAIIGEAPGADEVRMREPFVGMSGRFLSALIAKAGMIRDGVFIGNVCQVRPPGNDIEAFWLQGPEITAGLETLAADLAAFDPNICLLLGKTALWAANGESKITEWRGSIFRGTKPPFVGRKCIASYHPAACLRMYEWTPVLMFDIKKCLRHARDKEIIVPERHLWIPNPDAMMQDNHAAILQQLEKVKRDKPMIAIDIEGYVNKMTCISVATSSETAFIVPFSHRNGEPLWDEWQEAMLWRALADVLEDGDIPKVLQNSLYDRFVLQYSYDIIVHGVVDDTMLKHWEQYCELEKSLGFQASIYTEEPYWKAERKSDAQRDYWTYCCKDSAVTYEINQRLEPLLRSNPNGFAHYRLNMSLLNSLLNMQARGIRYNSELAAKRREQLLHHIYELQYDLDECSGYGLKPPHDRAALFATCQSHLCYKRDPDRPKKGNEAAFAHIKAALLSPEPITKALLGEISTACDIGLNTKSPKLKTFLYATLKLPLQTNKDGKPTTDYEALLKLSKKSDHPALKIALELSELRTRAQMLAISADPDGRVRCGYNIVGTETGRLSCYTSPTGSGYNLQTIPKGSKLKPPGHLLRDGMRDLFIADDGCYIFECDLSGADGWTVAAHLAALGDPTMLMDYRFGIKPAKVLCFLMRHGAAALSGKSREEIKELTKEVTSDSWDYFASKIGQHGTCYLMGPKTLANKIFIESEGLVNLSQSEAGDLQKLFMVRYRVKLWHDATARALSRRAEITAASGFKRRFFGRPKEILGEALAHEPQANTTYATNLAVWRLWHDRANLRPDGSFIVEPLHQVHDALVGQFRQDEVAVATGLVKGWFNNELIIAGQRITIPYEGGYGPSWGEVGTYSL